MSGQIAEFWASLGFKIAPDEIKKVDKFLGDAEKKLRGTNQRKTEEAKATTQVAKAVDKEVKAKTSAVKAEVAANKVIEQKAKAVDKLSTAEVRRARKLGESLNRLTPVNTAVQKRIESLFPALGRPQLTGKDRNQVTSWYSGAFAGSLAPVKTTKTRGPTRAELAAQRLGASLSGGHQRVNETVLNRINRMFPSMGVGVAKGEDRSLITSMYEGMFAQADAKLSKSSLVATPQTKASTGMTNQPKPERLGFRNRIDQLIPDWKKTATRYSKQDIKQITSGYRGLFDQAAAGKVGRRSPAILESAALNKIGINNPRFSRGGRVTEYLRAKALQPELSALGRIGQRSGSFKPTGWAMSQFDERLNQLQKAGQASIAARQRAGFVSRLDERLSYLSGPRSKSDELKSMANFYRQQERFAREELKLKKQGLRTEQQVERTRRQGMITERARNFQNRLSGSMSGAGGGSGSGGGTTILGSGGRNAASYGRANYLHAGGATGAFMRYGVRSLPFIGGMYGIGSLNRANQNLMSTEIAATSIFGDRANDAKSWLEQHSDYVGYSYLEAMPIFSSFMASGMPLMGYETSRGVFESLAEFGRTRGADPVSMKRAMTAIQQMAAKGQVMQEELKLQLSEAKGFGESRQIFAEAWQIKTGGNLTGAPAAAALLDAMQRGEVKSADLLPIVAMLMKELASGGIEKARQSSIAEQARVSNAGTKALRIFSENGGEKGFARLWKAMTIAIMEATPYVEFAGKAFNEISRVLSRIILIPQSFKRAFEGRDSLMMDIFGAEGISQIKDFVQILKETWDELKTTFGIVGEGWKLIIEEFGSGIIGFVGKFVGKIVEIFKYTLQAINRVATGNASGASDSLAAIRTVLGGGSSEDAYKVSQGVEVNIPSRRDLSSEDLMFRAAQRLISLPRPNGVIESLAYARHALVPQMELIGGFRDLVRDPNNLYYYNNPHGVLDMLNTRLRTEGGSNAQVVFQNGSIVITTAATDAEGIAKELTPMLERELQNMVITE